MTSHQLTGRQIAGSRVLIVEDEYYLANDARTILVDAGVDVIGPVATATDAGALIEANGTIDGVLLDVNLRGTMAFDVADRLQARGIPFVFVTGYDRTALPERFAAAPHVEKPVSPERLVSLVGDLTASREQQPASPMPRSNEQPARS